MSVMETDGAFDMREAAIGPEALAFVTGNIPLNVAAARVARGLKRRIVSTAFLAALARFADMAALSMTGLAILHFYVAPTDGYGARYFFAAGLLPLATIVLIGSFKGYTVAAYRQILPEIGRAAGLWTAVFGCFTLILFFLKMGEEFSRVWLATWFLAGLVALTVIRILLTRLVQRWTAAGVLERRAVLVGGGPEAVELIHALRGEPANDVRICGIFDDREDARVPAVKEGYPRLGRIDELLEFGRQAEIDMLIVALPMAAEARVVALLKRLWVLPVDIRLSAGTTKLRFRPRSYSFVGSVPFLDLFDKPIADWDSLIKRVFDVCVASLALVVLSPIFVLTALAIRLDSAGPILFRQRRYGFNNEVIEVLKFRSMHHHMADPTARKVVTKNDPRVTRIGRFIRKTSIDELPQLLNVITGKLSLVGPRPHAVNAHTQNQLWEELVDGYFARHRVKPGITGWAQVNGLRGEVDTEEKIRRRVYYDLTYIESWSVFFDLYILLLTPFRLLNTENAY
jgi:Undecaprenyl-phosphate glucose phosphotransferase